MLASLWMYQKRLRLSLVFALSREIPAWRPHDFLNKSFPIHLAFRRSCPGRTERPRRMHNGQNNADWHKDVSCGDFADYKLFWRGKSTKLNLEVKSSQHKEFNNTWTEHDSRKIPKANLRRFVIEVPNDWRGYLWSAMPPEAEIDCRLLYNKEKA